MRKITQRSLSEQKNNFDFFINIQKIYFHVFFPQKTAKDLILKCSTDQFMTFYFNKWNHSKNYTSKSHWSWKRHLFNFTILNQHPVCTAVHIREECKYWRRKIYGNLVWKFIFKHCQNEKPQKCSITENGWMEKKVSGQQRVERNSQ